MPWRLLRRLSQAVVKGRFEVDVTAKRGRIAERQYLRRPEAAKAVPPVDPVEQIGQTRPSERPDAFAERGRHALKGVPGEWQTHAAE